MEDKASEGSSATEDSTVEPVAEQPLSVKIGPKSRKRPGRQRSSDTKAEFKLYSNDANINRVETRHCQNASPKNNKDSLGHSHRQKNESPKGPNHQVYYRCPGFGRQQVKIKASRMTD